MQRPRFHSPRDSRRRGAATRGQPPSLARPLGFELLEERWLLAADTWVGGSGDWSNSAHWSAGVSTSSSQAQLIAGVTVTVSSGARVANSLTTLSTDTLSITGGSLTIGANFSNSGTLNVAPHITVTAGSFTQNSTGTLGIQLGGAPSSGAFGVVNATGAATLAGTFKVTLVSGYTPSNTDSFNPLGFASESGSFSTVSLPSGSTYQFVSAMTFTNLAISATPTTAVTSTINANASSGAVASNFLGVNLAYWDDQQATTQTQTMASAAGLQIYRFPGGSDADDFHFNLAANFNYSAAITIPQFVKFISSVNGVGVVTVDYGSGSPQEAAAELAYVQGSPGDTTAIGTGLEWNDSTGQWQSVNWGTVGYWASLRAAAPLTTDDGFNFMRLSHPTPYTNIKYWEIGNELYGDWETDHHGTAGPGGVNTGSPHDPATYVAFAQQFAALSTEILHAANPTNPAVISIGIDSGDPTGASDNNWTKNVLTDGLGIGFVPGFISDHSYMGGPGAENDSVLLNDTVSDPGSIFDWSTRHADYTSLLQQTLSTQASSVTLMATEFNSVYGDPGKESTSLVNGLFIANSIGSLLDSGYQAGLVWDLRNSWDTGENNSNLLYGWREGGDYGQLGDPYNTSAPSTGAYIGYPGYYALQLVSKVVDSGSQVVSATSNYGDLDVYAVKQSNGHLDLLVINTNSAASLSDQFNLTGFQPSASAQVWQYGETQDTAQSHTSNGASALANSSATLNVSGSNFSYSFPAYSMTVLDLSPVPIVTPSGTHASYTAGASAVHVDPAVTVTSSDTKLTSATVTISPGTLQAGDTLSFTSPVGSGISIASNSGGVLTLTGNATPAQYQAALQSVTFSSTSTSTTARAISIVAIDGALDSNPAAEPVNVSAPVTITAAYVAGSAWTNSGSTTNFDGYLASNALGNATTPSLGYALQTGASQLTTLPWANVNTISVSFSGPVTSIGLGSLELLGGTGGGSTGAVAAPSVTSFTSDGNNTYSWTLSGSLGNNKYVFAIATIGSSFATLGSTQVTDLGGAGISGTFATSSSSFPSGNGLAGSTFDFAFNVLPGDGNQNGLVNTVDTAVTRALVNDHENAAGYSPYFDYDGAGLINTIDSAIDGTDVNDKQSSITGPTAPADSQQVGGTEVGGTDGSDFTQLALGVQETGASNTTGSSTSLTAGSSQATSNQTSGVSATTPATTAPATNTPSTAPADSADSSTTPSNQATDEAVSDFDLADLYA